MSNKPVIADNSPARVELVQGKEYFFCNCGRSANQPFCDGSHKGTSFSPTPFIAERDGLAVLCACKHSSRKPFCDGSHRAFSDEQVGEQGPG